ncbi:MAG: NADH-quinone oxidoreductase subunit C [Granulosicoccus sp.]
MSSRLDSMLETLNAAFPDNKGIHGSLGLVVMDVAPADLLEVARRLHDDPAMSFRQMSDLCGVDYATYGKDEWNTDTENMASFSRAVSSASTGSLSFGNSMDLPSSDRPRFVVVYHLLSLDFNIRLRLRCAAEDDSMPVVPSICPIYAGANWYEREAFDLFGILFDGHPDLRRILTDYGFNGHPFRKDFPLIGNVEMRYDSVKERVVYEPVSIEPRVLVPRVIREDARYVAGEPSVPKDKN